MVICLKRGEDQLHVMHLMSLPSQNPVIPCRGVVGRGRGVTASPTFLDRGDASPHFFGLKFVQKLVHCCNWLLTETQCKIISVQQN